MKRDDLELEMPVSLKTVIIDEINAGNYDNYRRGKEVKKLDDATIDHLLRQIFAHIEKQALEVYHTNEPWALKSWAYANILKDVVASEETEGIVSELISPLIQWQNEDFDPVRHLRETLQRERKKERTREAYLQTAARFVSLVGRKAVYTDDEVNLYLTQASRKFPEDTSSYHHECTRLLQFLRRLPGGKGRDLPFRIPRMPKSCYQPMFSREQIESIIWCCLIDHLDAAMIARLATATIYGARLAEAAKLSNKHIFLDGKDSCITLPTEKEGEIRSQPIPVYLLPIFNTCLEPVTSQRLLVEFRRVCKGAGVEQPYKGGFHAIRRQVVTAIGEYEHSDINIHRFMRWSEPRQFAILSVYKKNPSIETDRRILDQHPFAKEWETMVPYLVGSGVLNNYPDKKLPNSSDSNGVLNNYKGILNNT